MIANTIQRAKVKLHNMPITITPNEYDRLWCGELTLSDFNTSHPNPGRIDKISYGVNKYLDYKKKKSEEMQWDIIHFVGKMVV